jgi:spermidine synthase
MKHNKLELVLFLSGAVVMILELVGSRIVAPYLGTSIYVWTSLIGIILGSLSLGYYWGGCLADKKPNETVLSLILLLAAALIGVISIIKDPLLSTIQGFVHDIRLAAVTAAIALFAPASIALGTISPYAVRLKMQTIASSGTTVGRLYAISTIGSIVGTFAAGFFLIAFFGSSAILLVLALTMLFTALLARAGSKRAHLKKFFGLMVLIIAIPFVFHINADKHPKNIDLDTLYNRIIIEERVIENTGKHVRYLRIDQKWAQSAVVLEDPDELFFEYNKFYRVSEHFCPTQRRALLIGGGAYTFARDFIRRHPDAEMDVVEIDPALTDIAKQFFFMTDDPRIVSIHEDGRQSLHHLSKQYDVIYLDVFKASASPPFHLMTREAIQSMASLLGPEGAVLVNIYSAIEGDKGKFLRAAYRTFRSVFPQVFLFPVDDPRDGEKAQNILLVAWNRNAPPAWQNSDPEINRYLTHRWRRPIANDIPVLSDEFAPVEHLLIAVIREYSSS